ncbi:MAG: hypothetical protein ABR928_13820 [Terracidiphilus sp.]|jgi:hypothetical protein
MKPDTQSAANYDAVDRILDAEDQIVPSSGFLASVMERVREEAIAPQPIPFPWKLAIPGMVLAAGTIGWLIYDLIRMAVAGDLQAAFEAPHLHAAQLNLLTPVTWIALALVLSLASWVF